RETIRNRVRPAVSEFPLCLINHDLMIDWFLGEKTNDDVRKVMLAIMSDPYAMFKYIVDATGHRETLYRLLRKGGEDLAISMQHAAQQMLPALLLIAQKRVSVDLDAHLERIMLESGFLRRTISGYAETGTDHIEDSDIIRLIKRAPSVSTS